MPITSKAMRTAKYRFINNHVAVIYDNTVPVYLVLGDRNVLVDCSVSARAADLYAVIQEILKEKSENQNIDSVLLTHSHYDHVGACSHFQDFFDLTVFASDRAVKLLKKPRVVETIKKLNRDFDQLMNDGSGIEFKGLKNLNVVAEGDKIPVGKNRYLLVYETPGHTQCAVSFKLVPDNILFPGDAAGFIDMDGSIKSFFFSSFKSYEFSLQKILKIGADVLALPHNKYIRGKERVKGYLNESLAASRNLRDKIMDDLKRTGNVEKTSENIVREEFPFQSSILDVIGSGDILLNNFIQMVQSVSNEYMNN